MKIETQDIKDIYDKLQDDLSRTVFTNRWLYAITDDEQYLSNVIKSIPYSDEVLEKIHSHDGQEIILFGAGFDGKLVYDFLCIGVPSMRCTCFVDNDIRKHGTEYCGLSVISVDELCEKHKNACVIISTNDYHDAVEDQLLQCGFPNWNIISGLTGEDSLTRLYERQYFDLPALPHVDDEVFVDGGVLDGLSTQKFRRWAQGKYKHAYLFEPNVAIHDNIKENLAGYENITLIGKGLWNQTTELAFMVDEVALGGSRLVIDGQTSEGAVLKVPVTSLDEALTDTKVTFIKLDIEGAEKMALMGAENIIRREKPKMAVCVYHKKEDIWELPKLLLEYRPDYKFYLRHYWFNACETVLYAI